MKRLLLFFCLFIGAHWGMAHDLSQDNLPLKKWETLDGKMLEGSFFKLDGSNVWLETKDHQLISVELTSLSVADQNEVFEKVAKIDRLNRRNIPQVPSPTPAQSFPFWALFTFFFLLVAGLFSQNRSLIKKVSMGFGLLFLGGIWAFSLGSKGVLSVQTTPSFIDSAFQPFKPNVHTFWNSTYFYVESKGIPTTHEMMVGITDHGWQQQVPVPQCYLGTNAWPIPLNPIMASNPIPVDTIHFTRGAIALAVNGVPIFNVHTNTGVDSYLDGQLDSFGGHSGRADDYHYHTAPLHLYNYTSTNMPCAFGLDGFPVYGSKEPDGTNMATLDANHGHSWNGGYHYHGTPAAPYMIARMAGQVTEDATYQLIPQPAARSIRPALTPLRGALITSCQPLPANNGYRLRYTLNATELDTIDYSWDQNGNYTYAFRKPTGTTTNNYRSFVQCQVPLSISPMVNSGLVIYPNPAQNEMYIQLPMNILSDQVFGVKVYNQQGQLVQSWKSFQKQLSLESLSKGIYFLEIQTNQKNLIQKFVKR